MFIDFLVERFQVARQAEAFVWRGRSATYADLLAELDRARALLDGAGVPPGAAVALEADFSPQAVALFLALIERGAVFAPLTSTVEAKKPEFREIAEAEHIVAAPGGSAATVAATGRKAGHELYARLRGQGHPGLVLFSSGSTGRPKAAVHDFVPLLDKFRVPRHAKRMMAFLLFDHIGGVNTMLYCLSNAGCLVLVEDRSPEAVAAAVERHRVQTLPTSPTFLNLLLLSRAWEKHDLGSLELITYGTEPMPESTLLAVRERFPKAVLQQTYGLSELGILRSKSRSSDSLWVKLGGEGFELRVSGGLLEIKARSAMLGYLNAPSPFTEDGWFKTGDAVEVDGEWLRLRGRTSEAINVGGEKVFPTEVESVILLLDGVEEVVVTGEPNPLTGSIVKAVVRLSKDEPPAEFRKRLWAFCAGRLPRFKVPQKVVVSREPLHSGRFKKLRDGLFKL